MLFLQGSRDPLAMLAEFRPLTASIGACASLKVIDGADHSFRVKARSGRSDSHVRNEMLDALAAWIEAIL
jgi:hypothetical protein